MRFFYHSSLSANPTDDFRNYNPLNKHRHSVSKVELLPQSVTWSVALPPTPLLGFAQTLPSLRSGNSSFAATLSPQNLNIRHIAQKENTGHSSQNKPVLSFFHNTLKLSIHYFMRLTSSPDTPRTSFQPPPYPGILHNQHIPYVPLQARTLPVPALRPP